MSPKDLFESHIAKFNAGVRSGDFQPMCQGFAIDAVMRFEGVEAGPYRGRSEIEDAYRANPPDDEINVLYVKEDGNIVHADYAWMKDSTRKAGTIQASFKEQLITLLIVRFS